MSEHANASAPSATPRHVGVFYVGLAGDTVSVECGEGKAPSLRNWCEAVCRARIFPGVVSRAWICFSEEPRAPTEEDSAEQTGACPGADLEPRILNLLECDLQTRHYEFDFERFEYRCLERPMPQVDLGGEEEDTDWEEWEEWEDSEEREEYEEREGAIFNGHKAKWEKDPWYGLAMAERRMHWSRPPPALDNFEIVVAAVHNWSHVEVGDLSSDLCSDRDFILDVLTYWCRHSRGYPSLHVLSRASEGLRGDREVIMAGLKISAEALSDASTELQADREMVYAAIASPSFFVDDLEAASKDLHADPEVLKAAIGRRRQSYSLQESSFGGRRDGAVWTALLADREVVLAVVESEPHVILWPSVWKQFGSDRDIVRAALAAKVGARRGDLRLGILSRMSQELKADQQVALAAIECRDDDDWYISPHTFARRLFEDRDFVLAAVGKSSEVLRCSAAKFSDDREVVLAAAKYDGWRALGCASSRLRADRDVVMAAVRATGAALRWASEDLRDDFEVVLAAVNHRTRQSGVFNWVLEYASSRLRADKEIAMAAVRQNGEALGCADRSLRADKEIVMAAVTQSGEALVYACENLRADREVVMVAVTQSGGALVFAGESLRADKEIVMAAVSQSGRALEYASVSLRADREIAMAAAVEDGSSLHFASGQLQTDRGLVLAAVRSYKAGDAKTQGRSEAASWPIPERLRCDRDFMAAAVQANGLALAQASEDLRDDQEIVTLAAQQNSRSLKWATTRQWDAHIRESEALQREKESSEWALRNLRIGDPGNE